MLQPLPWENDPVVQPTAPPAPAGAGATASGRSVTMLAPAPAPQPTPMTPEAAAVAAANARRDNVMAGRAGLQENYEYGPDGTARPIPGTPAASAQERGGLTPNEYAAVRRRYSALQGFDRSIREVESLFQRDFAGGAGGILGFGTDTNVAGRLPHMIRPENQTFAAAGQRIIDQIAEVFGITGGELNSLAELRARLGPYLPEPTDNDETIQNKITALRGIFQEQRGFLESQVRDEDRIDFGQPAAPGRPQEPSATGPEPLAATRAPGQVEIGFNAPEQTELTPEQRSAAEEAMRLFTEGRSPEEVRAALARGNLLEGNLPELLAWRERGGLDQWRRANPGQAYPFSGVVRPPDISDARGGGQEAQGLGGALGAISPFFGSLNAMTGNPESSAAFMRGAGDTLSFGFADEAAAAVAAAAGNGDLQSNLAYQRAINDYDEANNFKARLGGQIIGAAPFPMPAGAARGAGYAAYRTALTRQALAGAGYSAAYGYGSGDGSVQDRFANALIYGGVGAAAPLALTGAGRAVGSTARGVRNMTRGLTGRTPPATPNTGATPIQVAQAMADEGIGGSRAIADPSRRGDVTLAETTIPGFPIVREGMAETRDQIAARVRGLAGGGTVQDTDTAGTVLQQAGARRLKAMRRMAGSLYNRAERMAQHVGVVPVEAVATLTQVIDDLSRNRNRNSALVDYFTSVRADMVNSAGVARRKTVADMRDLRTGVAGEIDRRGLTRSNAERLMNGVLRSAARDIARDLGNAAPNAMALYRQGDDLWRRASVDERQIVQRLFGGNAENPISGEQVLKNIRTMMSVSGDARRFTRTMAMLTPAERANFRATIADPLGRTAPDMPFQTGTFVQQTNGLGDQQLREVFGPDGARSIKNLRLIARGFTDMSAGLNNSRSGWVMARQGANLVFNFKSSIGGLLGFAVAGPVGGVVGGIMGSGVRATTQYLSAHSVMNPKVTQWMASLARANNPGAIRQSLAQLRTLAAQQARENPVVGRELAELSGALTRAANDNGIMLPRSGAAAASPNERPEEQEGAQR